PAGGAALADEGLGEDIGPERTRDEPGVAAEVVPGEERSPAGAEVAAGGRAGEPKGIAVDERGGGHHRADGVAHEGGIEIAEAARAEVDEREQDGGRGERQAEG